MALERGALLADDSLKGAAWCRAHSALIDAWLAELFDGAAQATRPGGLALVAVGGYGRAELSPASDIDIMLLHDRRSDVADFADRIWYPVWDQGLHLSHSVATVGEAMGLAAEDLDAATAFLNTRHVAGDPSLTGRLAAEAMAHWQKRRRSRLTELGSRVEARHQQFGEVAFQLEPDLKEGRGGLRDVQALEWAEAAHRTMLDHDQTRMDEAYGVILGARVELQRITRRPGNVLVMQEQAAVADALGEAGADALMARIAEAGRLIAWTSDDAWRRVGSQLTGRRSGASRRTQNVAAGICIKDGEVQLDETAAEDDPFLALRAAHAAAGHDTVIERHSLERLARRAIEVPEPWPPEQLRLFVELLLCGASAIRVIEALDQRGVWVRFLPEWGPVTSRPQHNAYHQFTVDRHLLETVAQAAFLADKVGRPDLLMVAALLHDLGKGYEGDHSVAGARLAGNIGARMGFSPPDVETLCSVVEHHLLLPDVATRRDLDDPATAENVAKVVGDLQVLELLAALTQADSIATGPSAWGPWKASLLGQLVDRVSGVLDGRGPPGRPAEAFPTSRHLDLLASSGRSIDAREGTVTVVTEDRPGTFGRVAGVLALHGLDVLSAAAHSTEQGRALSEFRVADPVRETPRWEKIVWDLELALDGRLALPARLADRARLYGRPKPMSRRAVVSTVSFHNDASSDATVVEVQAPDGVGVLYRITGALADLDLDIRSAKVQTFEGRVVDAFYVRDRSGKKITDTHALGEIERAVLHSVVE